MKFALIASREDFELVEFFSLGYHLVLAQEALVDTKYREYYCEKARQGHFIIMDNGAAEQGQSIPFSDVIEAANFVGADEIVMPDKLKDKDATIAAHMHYCDDVPPRHRMIVPQGDSIEQWIACLEELAEMMDFRSIGIPKHLDDYGSEGGRKAALEYVGMHWSRDANIHMLGCHSAPLKEVREAYKIGRDWLRGIDTAAPIAYAQHGQSVGYTKHLSYMWNHTLIDVARAHTNVQDMLSACAGL